MINNKNTTKTKWVCLAAVCGLLGQPEFDGFITKVICRSQAHRTPAILTRKNRDAHTIPAKPARAPAPRNKSGFQGLRRTTQTVSRVIK